MKTEPLSFATLAKIALAGLLVYGLIEARSVLFLLALAGLIATALDPILQRLERGMPRIVALLTLVLLGGLIVALTFYFVIPPLLDQSGRIAEHIPNIMQRLLRRLPEQSFVRASVDKIVASHQTDFANIDKWLPHLLAAGQLMLSALTSLLLLYVFTIYFLLDGRRAFLWISSFFGVRTRQKILHTAHEVVPVISGYVIGQVITSLLACIFVFTLLKIMSVPAALTLGVLAAIFDVLPLIGFFLSVVPALGFALTVSPTTAAIVVSAFTAYHLFEAYVITPMVYGKRLRLSGLSVLLGLMVGSGMGGIVGAVVILPIIASYPIIERIWLKSYLGTDTLSQHSALEHSEDELDALERQLLAPESTY